MALACSTRDPERGWDSGRVKGVLARLACVKRAQAATALEVAAGGRLYQVRGHRRGSKRYRTGSWGAAAQPVALRAIVFRQALPTLLLYCIFLAVMFIHGSL
jgi:hypothetical protein